MPDIVFTLDGALNGSQVPIAYLIFNSKPVGGSVTPYYWGDKPLAASAFYLDPRVVSFGTSVRALSDWMGLYETATFEVTISDWDQLIATLLEGSTTKYLANREAVLYLHEDNLRRLGYTPISVMRGIIKQVDPQAGRQVKFLGHDYITAEFGAFTASEKLPRRRLDTTTFSGLPTGNVGRPEPIIYGAVTGTVTPPSGDPHASCLPIYTGTEALTFTGSNPGTVTYHRFIIACHACYEVGDCRFGAYSGVTYMGNGGIIAPYVVGRPSGTWYDGANNPSWVGRSWYEISGVTTPYRTFNGKRYTVIYVDLNAVGPFIQESGNGSMPLTFQVKGIESVGDGSGTLITDAVLQYEHCVRNFLLGDYQTGSWLSTPTSPISGAALMDSATWTTASNEKTARYGGPYVGAGVLGGEGESESIAEWLARWNLSADVFLGFNKSGQLIVRNDVTSGVTVILSEVDIIDGSFAAPVEWDRLANVIPYAYWRDHASGSYAYPNLALSNAASITAFAARKVASTRELWFVRDANVAKDIAKQWLRRQKDLPRRVIVQSGLHAISQIELGDRVTIKHRDGPASNGAYSATVHVVRITPSLDDFSVSLEGYDLSAQEANPSYTEEVLSSTTPVGDPTMFPSLPSTTVPNTNAYVQLGGSRQFGLTTATALEIPESKTFLCMVGGSYTFRAKSRTSVGTTSVTVRLYDVTASSSACTLGTHSNTTPTDQSGTAALIAGHEYRVEVQGGNANAQVFVLQASVER